MGKSGQDGGVDGGGEVQEDEGAEQQGQPGLQGEEEEEAGGGGAGVDHLAGEEHPPAGRVQEHAGRGGPVQEKDPRAGFRSEKLNIHLQAVFKSMQEEVALYKKRILEQVSGVRN